MNPPEESPDKHEASENTTPQKPISSEVLQLLTKHYTDQFWSTLAKTGVILLAWIATLTLMFVDPIFQLRSEASKQTRTLRDIERQQDAARLKLVSSARNLKTFVVPLVDDDPTSPSPTPVVPSEEQPEARNEERRAPQATIEQTRPSPTPTPTVRTEGQPETGYEERRQVALERFSKLRTPLGELNIPIIFAPLIWSLLFAALLAFFLQRRLLLIATLAKIVELRRISHSDSFAVISGLGSWTPFWLAPLPEPSGTTTLDDATLRGYLGWGRTERWRSLLTKACIGAALCAHLYVAITAVFLVRAYRDPSQALAVCLAVIGIFLSCVMASIVWLRPRVELGSFPVGFVQMDKGRRRFLAAGVSLASFGFLLALITALVPKGYLKGLLVRLSGSTAPRFRRLLRPEGKKGYENSFQRNTNSFVIHYFGRRGLTSNREFLSQENLTKVELEEVLAVLMVNNTTFAKQTEPPSWKPIVDNHKRKRSPHLNLSQSGALIECLALERWATDRRGALDLIRVAILFDSKFKKRLSKQRPSYRLYDLYAGLAYKLQDRPAIDDLINYAQAMWKGDEQMTKRIQKWTAPTPSANYSSKWNSEVLLWKTGLPKDPSHYNGRCLQ